ncbi:LacI family DNA-binding transcriptional regulator [uncultured Amnibacterium sp.]|uniref:LacI family DNA-binding transcriptional regulator n=1 Tax=uncultured Amnibacterium sp. TaxID=1631851 RepID=UPI0035CC1D95
MSDRVSVREVAVRAGVSVGTVSNVLNTPDKVAGPTAERVHRAIQELGFVPNGAARQLRAGRSTSVGFVVLDVSNPFFTDVARAAEERAAEEGWGLLIANSDERADRESAHLDLFEEQRVRGLLVSPVQESLPKLQRLRDRGIPSVLVDRLATEPGFSSVSVDDVRGGRAAVEHLLAIGRRRILFVGGPLDLAQVRDRLRGAREAVAAVEGAALEVLPVAGLTMRQGVVAGREVLAQGRRADAVFAANDLVALGVLQGVALNGGLRVPDDLAIVGYDDIDFAAAAAVPITSVRQPRRRMGVTAVELLLDAIAERGEPRRIVLEPELIVRDSTSVR